MISAISDSKAPGDSVSSDDKGQHQPGGSGRIVKSDARLRLSRIERVSQFMSFRDAKSTVEVEDLRREFKGKEGRVLALDGVDLKVREGEVFGVLGPNGAGKTTMIRI